MPIRLLPILALFVLSACTPPVDVAIDVRADSVSEMEAALAARLPALRPIPTEVEPDGLWRKSRAAPDEIAVLGYAAEAGKWRVPPSALAGDAPGPSDPPLADFARTRLERFLRQVRLSPAVTNADQNARPAIVAAHVTRALASEIVAKYDVRQAFVHFDARAPDLPAYVADAARDLVDLAGLRAPVVIWVRDDNERRVFALRGGMEALLR